MEVGDFQKKIVEFVSMWDKKRGAVLGEQVVFIHLVEEIGELAREYVNKESRIEMYDEEELEDAIGDAFIQLVRLSDLRGLDIERVVSKIIAREQKLLET